MQAVAYRGSPDRPIPPAEAGWGICPYEDEIARSYAQAFGPSLPAYHYADALTPAGLYRLFAFESATGQKSIGALRFIGTGMAGAEPIDPDPSGDGGGGSNQPPTRGEDTPPSGGEHGGVTDTTTCPDGTVVEVGQPCPEKPKPGGGGKTTSEPVPTTSDGCSWVPDASVPEAVAVATSISYHNTPVVWTDQGKYDATLSGTKWRFVMWYENDKRMVAAFRCVPGGDGPPKAMISSSALPWVLGAVAVVGLAGAAMYFGGSAATA